MKIALVLCAFIAVTSARNVIITRPKLPSFSIQSEQGRKIEGRITNGDLAKSGDFPYQCGLSLAFEEGNAWCGGTLISDRWVITAAHCTDGALGVTVYLGAIDIRNKDEKTQQRIYSAKSYIHVHEGWDPTILKDDIALIKLPVKISFNDYIKPATLPKKSATYSSYAGEMVVASGWGKDSDQATGVSQYLRFIEVPVLEKRNCNVYYLGSITDKMICIDTEGAKSTCNGDSGGPLVHKENDINYLVGATSFGIIFGCEKGWPGVFTRITSYIDWIETNTGVVNV